MMLTMKQCLLLLYLIYCATSIFLKLYESSTVSIPTQLLINILEPYYTCFCFNCAQEEPYGFWDSVTIISDIVS